MADDDYSARTEEATPRRLRQGRERGQVAQSQDVRTWAVLAAVAVCVSALIPRACRALAGPLVPFLDAAGTIRIGPDGAARAVLGVLVEIAVAIAPVLGVIMAAAIAASLAQTGFLWATERVVPDFGRVSPLKGLQRQFSANTLVDFTKGMIKITVVALVFAAVAIPFLENLEATVDFGPVATLDRLHDLCVWLAAGTAGVLTIIAAADYGYQRFTFLKEMRMTKQEIREEYKESEGDPHIKARIRKLRAERARKRMMAAVPTADVVITNPTHFAVALRYEMATMPAPKVVAKGVDALARRIRALAESHEVPIVENPPLARALHAAVEVDDEIPPEHYEAVARIIGYVMRLKGRRA
jgi:flagellar biosynthetic protein FlhB